MSLSIKSILIRNNGKTEIRRFIMDEDTKGKSFNGIWEKINKLYGDNLQEKGFMLFWKDDDDDDVMMTSEEELGIAIKEQKADTLKIYIQKPKHGRRSSKQDSSEAHNGITCDGCEGGVYGMRYKCLQCHDYDLCSTCEHKNLHSDHLMVRIPSPSVFGSGMHGFPFWMFGGGRGRHGCGWRRMHRFHPSHQRESHSQQSDDQAFHPGNFLENLWRVVGNFVPQAGARTNPQASNENQDAKTPPPPTPNEYLQTVGESVAAMLDPLGIDVIVDVEHDGERKRCEVPRQDSNQPSTSTKADDNKQETVTNEKPAHDAMKDNELPSKDQPPEVPLSSESMKQRPVASNPFNAQARAYISNLTKVLGSLSVNQDDSAGNEPQSHTESDWTYINYCDKDHENRASPQHTDVKTVHDSNSEAAATPSTPSHPDPVIALAVNQMMSMGYDNENDWLVTLLELNNGNVDQTLEQIHSLQNNDKMTEFITAFIQKNPTNFDRLLQALQSAKKYSNLG